MTPCDVELHKSWGAKDYGRLVPVQKVRSDGRRMTYWTLPEDAKQAQMFDADSSGKESGHGGTGYFDHVVDGTDEYRVKPLLREIEKYNKDLAPKFQYKYENYVWDRDTRDMDLKIDERFLYYAQRKKMYPSEADEWEAEFEAKVGDMVRQVNNRKRSMIRAKVGMQVKFRGVDGAISGFSRRGFPVVKTDQGTYDAFWEEVAQSAIDNRA
jgi:hypothetical protein